MAIHCVLCSLKNLLEIEMSYSVFPLGNSDSPMVGNLLVQLFLTAPDKPDIRALQKERGHSRTKLAEDLQNKVLG
jgi:hypothetical protein